MKLDYDLIKKILEKIEAESNGQDTVWIKADKLSGTFTQEQIDYHLQILEDDYLVKITSRLKGVPGKLAIDRLTAEGHRVLEAMVNDTIWNKIKDGLSELGVDGLKKIPGLAIKFALEGYTS